MKRRSHTLLLPTLFAACLNACSGTDTPSGPPEKLVIAEASQTVFALVYVAEAKGYFKEAGLDVTFKSFLLGRDALASVIEGESDIATVYSTPVINRLYEGKPLGIVSTLHTSTRNTTLVARRDRGISKPADFEGKRIGVTRGTSTEYFLHVFLATEGIPADRVRVVDIEPAGYQRALLDASVDALVLFGQHTVHAQEALREAAVPFHAHAYVEMSMLVGMRPVLEGKREAVARMLKAIVKAQDHVERNQEESIAIVVRRLAGKFDEKVVRENWANFTPVAKLDNVMLSVMTMEAQWLRDSGKFGGPLPDIARAVMLAPLQGVRPDAVTIKSHPVLN